VNWPLVKTSFFLLSGSYLYILTVYTYCQRFTRFLGLP